MRSIRFLSGLAAAFLFLVSVPGFAAEMPFTQEAFADAQSAGKPILVEIHASWCPTCRAQKPIIDGLTSKEPYSEMTVLRVDYDGQKDVVRAFDARQQSTLIVFKGDTEVGRSVGDTRAASIEALLDKAI